MHFWGKKIDKTIWSLLWYTPIILIWLHKPLLVPFFEDSVLEAPKNHPHFDPSFRRAVVFFFNVICLLSSFRDFSWFLVPKGIPFYFPALIWVYFIFCFLLLFLEVRKGGWSMCSVCHLPTESPIPFCSRSAFPIGLWTCALRHATGVSPHNVWNKHFTSTTFCVCVCAHACITKTENGLYPCSSPSPFLIIQ